MKVSYFSTCDLQSTCSNISNAHFAWFEPEEESVCKRLIIWIIESPVGPIEEENKGLHPLFVHHFHLGFERNLVSDLMTWTEWIFNCPVQLTVKFSQSLRQ